jgi:uncharacterized membrane protein YbaN (DUF454 family)
LPNADNYAEKVMKRTLLIIAGFTALSFGIAGIFLPVLPTTPFVLLSAACFLHSSKRLYGWLTGHKVLGGYIKSYLKYRAVSIKSKIISITLLWVMILTSVFFFVPVFWVKILLVAIAAGVTIHLLCLKTLTKEILELTKKEETGTDTGSG